MAKIASGVEVDLSSLPSSSAASTEMMVCPVCGGAAEFQMVDPIMRTVTKIMCWECRGERLVYEKVEWLN